MRASVLQAEPAASQRRIGDITDVDRLPDELNVQMICTHARIASTRQDQPQRKQSACHGQVQLALGCVVPPAGTVVIGPGTFSPTAAGRV